MKTGWTAHPRLDAAAGRGVFDPLVWQRDGRGDVDWRGKVTDDFVRKQVVSDPHSPRRFRVLGPTRNIDDWYESFGVKPDDARYIAPDQRVRIW